MGKIRVKTIGDDNVEEMDKKKSKVKREEKLNREKSTSVEKTEEDASANKKEEIVEKEENKTEDNAPQKKATKSSYSKKTSIKEKARSTNYTENAMKVDKNKLYSIGEGIELLKSLKKAKFDETVELHINTTESGISGTMTLPHGNGKQIKVAIVSDELLEEVGKGKINFDVLIAAPTQMSQLAKVAKVLGPKGLMPNPKNGTISDKPEEAAKKFQGGQMNFKTESKLPLIHLTIGKVSFEDSKLKENITYVISIVKKNRIKSMTLKSTMSPGIKIQL